MSFSTKPLDMATWPDFAALVERHNGVWGGCWCMAFHAKGSGAVGNREAKEAWVREQGRTVAGAFLHNGTLAMFERQGFSRNRQIGKHRWVVEKRVAARG
ncbi:MAG: hypothetical protein E5W28_07565 [Mesorhizobium sp.]|nr:MAG: hypothetical protein E5W28_07565 [Mesorhizobium sp.]